VSYSSIINKPDWIYSGSIPVSFNAFSVDNSQQPNKEEFNKEAYLDLSKPYKQNTPQSVTKKDNQATA
jgi:hypothetical protein